MSGESPERPLAEEAALLAGALRAELLRLGRRGRRRLPRAAPPEDAAGAPVPAPRPAAASGGAPAGAAAECGPRTLEEIRARAAACGDLEALRAEVAACTACGLAQSRTQTVFADGTGRAGLMFVGEAPGADEDASGVPFVGQAGRLLTDIVTKGMGLSREDVYIANVLKCRPPGNRDPAPEEKSLCTGWLDRQIELVDPAVVVPLGRHAAGALLESRAPLGRLRQTVHASRGRKIVPTYHPAYLLRSPEMKPACWADIQLAMRELGISRPPKAPNRG